MTYKNADMYCGKKSWQKNMQETESHMNSLHLSTARQLTAHGAVSGCSLTNRKRD